MAVITTIRSAFGFLTRLPVGPWPLQNDLNGISAWLPPVSYTHLTLPTNSLV